MNASWISVKDRLPEIGVGVLVFIPNVGITSAERDIIGSRNYWTGHLFGGYEWEFFFSYHDVTHWTELPEGAL